MDPKKDDTEKTITVAEAYEVLKKNGGVAFFSEKDYDKDVEKALQQRFNNFAFAIDDVIEKTFSVEKKDGEKTKEFIKRSVEEFTKSQANNKSDDKEVKSLQGLLKAKETELIQTQTLLKEKEDGFQKQLFERDVQTTIDSIELPDTLDPFLKNAVQNKLKSDFDNTYETVFDGERGKWIAKKKGSEGFEVDTSSGQLKTAVEVLKEFVGSNESYKKLKESQPPKNGATPPNGTPSSVTDDEVKKQKMQEVKEKLLNLGKYATSYSDEVVAATFQEAGIQNPFAPTEK